MAKTNRVSKKQLSQKNAPRGLLVGALIALVVLAGLGLTASRQPEAPAVASAPPLPLEVSVSEAAALRDSGAFILDVREPYEWEAGHIPGAALIPLGELTGRAAEVPPDRQVGVVCRSGNRSAVGRDLLLEAGLEQVTSMGGGMNRWVDAGDEVISGP